MARMRLRDDDGCVFAATVKQLDDVEAVWTAQHRTYVARLHFLQGFGKQWWKAVRGAPPEFTPFKGILRIGVSGCYLGKRRTAAQFGQGLFGTVAIRLYLVGTGLLRHDYQNMSELQFFAFAFLARLVGQIVVDIVLADHQLAIDFALTQTNRNDFVADFFPEFLEVSAILLQFGAECGYRGKLVLLCDTENGLVQLIVVNAQPNFLGKLRLQHFHDHAFQHLSFKYILVWQRSFLLLQHLRYAGNALVQLAMCDDIVVHDNLDPVKRNSLFWRLGCGGSGRQAKQNEGENLFVKHVHFRLWVVSTLALCWLLCRQTVHLGVAGHADTQSIQRIRTDTHQIVQFQLQENTG